MRCVSRRADHFDMNRSRWAGFVMLLALLLATSPAMSAEPGGVEIKRRQSAQIKRFDPDRPAAEMPPLEPPEAAVTVSSFSCSAQMRVLIVDEQQRGGNYHASATVESINISLGLDVTMWLPRNATRKIRDHEQAHRKISDHYFDLGEQAARDLAEPYIGRVIEGSAASRDEAVDGAIKAAIREIAGGYMSRIESRAGQAQKIFDELTDHGRNDVKEDSAIRDAIEQAGD